jgi:hypothetical protein
MKIDSPPECHRLFNAAINDQLSEAERVQLATVLKASPEARQLWFLYQDNECSLTELKPRLQVKSQREKVPRLSWRPLTAAAAGLVIGLFSATCVFAYSRLTAWPAMKSISPVAMLLDEGFEGGDERFQAGFPLEAGVWGGPAVHMVGARDGIAPVAGRRMLRVEPEDATTLSYLDRIFDLSGLPLPAGGGSRHVEVTAWFHAGEAGLPNRFTLRAAAFSEEAGVLRKRWVDVPWREMDHRAVAMAKRGISTPPDAEGWQQLTVRVEAPPEARSLVISLAGGLYETPDRRSAHYLDEVRAMLWLLPRSIEPRMKPDRKRQP